MGFNSQRLTHSFQWIDPY
uniref:Uncharacterized protein n=1 Tax=Anopheles quadriannulatus TaxID=34691 RepID=A0A182XQ89_ANOQN